MYSMDEGAYDYEFIYLFIYLLNIFKQGRMYVRQQARHFEAPLERQNNKQGNVVIGG